MARARGSVLTSCTHSGRRMENARPSNSERMPQPRARVHEPCVPSEAQEPADGKHKEQAEELCGVGVIAGNAVEFGQVEQEARSFNGNNCGN